MDNYKITDEQANKIFKILNDSLIKSIQKCFDYCIKEDIAGTEFAEYLTAYLNATTSYGLVPTLYVAASKWCERRNIDIDDLLSFDDK